MTRDLKVGILYVAPSKKAATYHRPENQRNTYHMASLPSEPTQKKRHPISTVLSCRELAEILKPYGDLPLMSGRTDYAITGFKLRADGLPSTTAVQVDIPPVSQHSEEVY